MSVTTHTPESPIDLSQEVGFCFLKPDYVDISDDFEADLNESGLDVVHRRRIVLPIKLIDYIYSDSRGEDFYPTMREELSSREILAMIVARQYGQGPEDFSAQYALESLKRGLNGYPNLRKKYHRPEHKVNNQTFADWREKRLDPSDLERVTIQLTQQNVFHASDGSHDGIGTLLRFLERNRSGKPGLFDGELGSRATRAVCKLEEILTRHAGEHDMSKIKREWRVIQDMPEHDKKAPIRQVYVWLLTNDEHVVVVSKDGEKWQLPGGKPDEGETALQTATRETLEETGVDISEHEQDVQFFGEYTIDEPETTIHPPRYRQVRSWLKLPVSSHELRLSTAGEADGQRPEDAVRFVRAVPINDVLHYIPWMSQTDEYKALKRNKVIPRADSPL